MNSYNHYAYGAVIDWVYEKAAGLGHDEDYPGFSRLRFEPHPDKRLGWLDAELESRHGTIRSRWEYTEAGLEIELETPVPADVVLLSGRESVNPGRYHFVEKD